MVQLYMLMWILAAFCAVIGFMRGWNREVIATAGVLLGMFALFQFDSILRGFLLLSFNRDQTFIIQMALFMTIVFFSYQSQAFVSQQIESLQSSILGAVVGFFNGYIIGGTIWYFMDINEYPFPPYILSPAPDSPSAQSLGSIPLVIMSGGVAGSGELLVIAVVVLILIVLIVL